MKADRRKFIKQSLTTAAGLAASAIPGHAGAAYALSNRPTYSEERSKPASKPANTIKFSVIGLNHGHIYGQTEAVIRGGGELVSFYGKEPDLAEAFAKRYPNAKLAKSEKEILDDKSIQLVVSASIPVDRAPTGH
jgi:hypothetical protein